MTESIMVVTVRRATVEDAAGIASSHVRSWQEGYRHVIPGDFLDGLNSNLADRTARWQAQILGATAQGRFVLVGEVDGEIAGWLTGGKCRDEAADDQHVGEVHGCYVDPANWRRGVGSALMAEALELLAIAGYVYAILWVLDDNPRARAFYERHGWVCDGGRQMFTIAEVSVPEVRYRRSLG